MSAARASLLERLGEFGRPTTVNELARRCGQHPNTVREHLEALVAAGLVEREVGPSRGRGRPALVYVVLPPEESRPVVREYAALASALAGHIARHSPDPVAAALDAGARWGQEIIDQSDIAGPARQVTDPVAAVVKVLDRLGFAPRVDPDAIRLVECPILAAARRDPDVVCGVHTGLLRRLYTAYGADGTQARIEAFAEPGACLVQLPRPPEEAS